MASLCHFAPQDTFKLRDVTEDAKEVVKCVRELTPNPRDNYTLLHFVEIFRGEGTIQIAALFVTEEGEEEG